MDKLHRTGSREVWRCEVCEFDNSILLGNCQMCESKKPQKFMSIIKEQKLQDFSTSASTLKTLICLDEKCRTENDINEIQCKKCTKFLIKDLEDSQQESEEIIKQQKKEKVQMVYCHRCNFQNDPANIKCVNCNSKMKKKKIPKPPKILRIPARGPNFCLICNTYKRYDSTGTFNECNCPDPGDLLPIHKPVCSFCFDSLKQGEYDSHVQNCKQRQIFYDKSKNKSYERLTPLQINTIVYMHNKCEKLHFVKQRKLEKRIEKLGFHKKDLQNLYHYIVNYAPIIIHMHANTHFQFFVKDTHYRSQFETSKSSGSLSRASRVSWQDRMFDNMHHNAKDFERVKYGTMNFTNDPHGVAVCSGYGQSYFMLKQHVRDRCTMTDMDSSSPNATICTFRFCYHLLSKLSDNEIRAAFDGSKGRQIKSAGIIGAYKQIQIHGPVEFKKDIQRVYIHRAEVEMNPNCIKEVQQFCKNNALDYELFGQVPKPIIHSIPASSGMSSLMPGFGLGAPSYVEGLGLAPGAPLSSGFIHGIGLGFGGGSMFAGPAPKIKGPIKYAPVIFPYSSKPSKQKDQDEDYI